MKTFARIILFLWVCLFNFTSAAAQVRQKKTLKAILVVGYQEDGTDEAILEMDKIANLFQQNKVEVYRFYNKDAEWDEIVKTAKNCHFLVYSGHGSNMGEKGNAGGICINSMVSSATIMKELKMKDNSMVLFQSVCNGAGSSASDNGDIGIREARKRVTHYAKPFFKVGAQAYVANNYSDGIYDFLSDFLSGTPLKKAFVNIAEEWSDIQFDEAFTEEPGKTFSIASSDRAGYVTRIKYVNGKKRVEKILNFKEYDVAYVGPPEFSIEDMK